MAFPTSPTNGQSTTINGITYVFDGTAWTKQGAVATASAVSSVAGRTGVVVLTAADIGAGTFPGALTASGALTVSGMLTASGGLTVAGTITASSNGGFATATYTNGSRNPIWRFGNADGYGLSYFQGSAGIGSRDTIGLHFGTATAAASQFQFTDLGGFVASGSTQVASLGVGTAASGTTGEIRATNYITAFYSDKRLKNEIGRIENALDKVDQLTGILYTQNELAESFGYNNYEVQVGLRAQDVQIAQPEAVKPAPFDIAEDGSSKSGENYLTVQYEKLVPLLVEAIKELRVELNTLKGQK